MVEAIQDVNGCAIESVATAEMISELPVRARVLVTAMGIFLFFSAIMASLAAFTLLWPGTALDRLWKLNPTAYQQLAPRGCLIGILFLLLGMALAAAGIGWFRRRLWGWRLAIIIIGTQVLGDIVNCVRGDLLGGGTGIVIAGALLLILLRPKTRATFS